VRGTTSAQPREVCLQSSLGEDTWLPGVAPRDRGQPNQDPSDHQHDIPAVSQGCPATDRQIGRLEQIHLQIRRAQSTLPQDIAWCKRLRLGPKQATAFESLKQHMSDLATLASPDPSLPLLLYIVASPCVVSAALIQEQDREGTTRQCLVYYVSEVLTVSKCNMTELEKISYAVVMASRKLHHYFEAFKVQVTSDRGMGELFRNPEASV
jgi:hypothetical protein